MRNVILLFSLLIFTRTEAQPVSYSARNGHAHNDYAHARPFFDAWAHGFGSIEADIFPVNGELLVGHSAADLKPARTLSALYLAPLAKILGENSTAKVRLLIDIKTDYKTALPLLVKKLGALRKYCARPGRPNRLTILISGNRPPPRAYPDYPDYIFFDDDKKVAHTRAEWQRVGMVSLQFSRFSTWDGTSPLPDRDRQKLRSVIDAVHASGKPIRFWAAPDTPQSWELQKVLKADYIGADDLDGLKKVLTTP